MWERVYCWVLIVLGFAGGAVSTYTALWNIVSADFQVPCYLQGENDQMEVQMSAH